MDRKRVLALVICLIVMLVPVSCHSRQKDGRIETDKEISPSLVYDNSMELEYATGFAVDYYDGGYALITISDGSRFFVIPEGKEEPKDLDEDVIIIRQPVSDIYLVASAVMDMFCSLDSLDSISLCGLQEESWYIEEAKDAMASGEILYAGKYNMPDYEKILDSHCGLAIESTMILHSPQVKEELERFGIPVLVDYSSYEEHPLGRCEWIKMYGTLLGKNEKANEAFLEQKSLLEEAAKGEKTKKTVAFFYIDSNKMVHVRKSKDYVPKMIELAGGEYIFKDLGSEDEGASSTVNMQMEEFYAKAKDADYLIYNSTIDGGVSSIEELLEKSSLLEDFKAVKEGKVFCTSQNLYQDSMKLGTVILEIHKMLTKEDALDEAFTYLFQLE